MRKPIQLKPQSVFIKAPRQMVLEMMTTFGKGRMHGSSGDSSRLICKDGNSMVVEFRTKSGFRTYVTLEQVTLEPPHRVKFKNLSGPLDFGEEEFILEESQGDTRLIHTGSFYWKDIPVIAYLVERLYIKRAFERLMVRHLEELKQGIESRAARSHVYKRTD